MGFDPLSIGLMVAGSAASYSAQRSAANVQEDAGRYQADLLTQQAENDTEARLINSRRLAEDQERDLARVRVIQANSGTSASEGTASLVFDDVRSRLDERLDDFLKGTSSQIARTENSVSQALWQSKSNANATRLTAAGGLISGLTKAGARAYQTYGPQPNTSAARPYSLF